MLIVANIAIIGSKKGIMDAKSDSLTEQQGHREPNDSLGVHRAGVWAALKAYHGRAGRRQTQGFKASKSSTGQVKGRMLPYGTGAKDNG